MKRPVRANVNTLSFLCFAKKCIGKVDLLPHLFPHLFPHLLPHLLPHYYILKSIILIYNIIAHRQSLRQRRKNLLPVG